MGNQASQQQNQQVYYDPSNGQYYTQTPQSSSPFAFLGQQNAGMPSMGNSAIDYMFGIGSGKRNYLGGMNNNDALIAARVAAANAAQPMAQSQVFNVSPDIASLLSNTSGSSGAGRFLNTVSNNSKSTNNTKA